MPAWKVEAYSGMPSPVLDSPLEQGRVRVFSCKAGLQEHSFAHELEEAIVANAKLPEEYDRKDEIIENFLYEYRNFNHRTENKQEITLTLERVEDNLNYLQI
ncbi:MAG: hypothetical protein EOM62_11325 [Bacteroidia bacterium]|nr:hypothetical protein [Bacteroidia bacterium]